MYSVNARKIVLSRIPKRERKTCIHHKAAVLDTYDGSGKEVQIEFRLHPTKGWRRRNVTPNNFG